VADPPKPAPSTSAPNAAAPAAPAPAGAAPPGDGAAVNAAPADAAEAQSAVLEKTQPVKLKQLAEKAAKQRRRTTAAELLVKRPRNPEVRVPLDRSETIIGRDPRCDIVLGEESVSRRHARIGRNTGGYFEIVDLGSRNGIVVADERVDRMTLLDGDVFVIGETTFTIAVGPILGTEG
jgi:S-DNA-T family DNA segregation ATPase FtsK/SpoIIIE